MWGMICNHNWLCLKNWAMEMRACVLTTRDLSFQILTPKLLQDHANFLGSDIQYYYSVYYSNSLLHSISSNQFLLSFSFMPVLLQLKPFFFVSNRSSMSYSLKLKLINMNLIAFYFSDAAGAADQNIWTLWHTWWVELARSHKNAMV